MSIVTNAVITIAMTSSKLMEINSTTARPPYIFRFCTSSRRSNLLYTLVSKHNPPLADRDASEYHVLLGSWFTKLKDGADILSPPHPLASLAKPPPPTHIYHDFPRQP